MTDYFHLNAEPELIRGISSLGLAHLGDGVFELMVRSCQCAALMPSMQFSYAVWQRSPKPVREIILSCVRLRSQYGGYLGSLLLCLSARKNKPQNGNG